MVGVLREAGSVHVCLQKNSLSAFIWTVFKRGVLNWMIVMSTDLYPFVPDLMTVDLISKSHLCRKRKLQGFFRCVFCFVLLFVFFLVNSCLTLNYMVVTHISKISKYDFYDIDEIFKEYNWHISEVYPPQNKKKKNLGSLLGSVVRSCFYVILSFNALFYWCVLDSSVWVLWVTPSPQLSCLFVILSSDFMCWY